MLIRPMLIRPMLIRLVVGSLFVSSLLCATDARLSEAAMNGDKAAVKTLLQQHADIDGAQGDGTTALHWAAFNDDLDLAKTLVAVGANVRATTRLGAISPLFMACTNGNAAMIEVLVKAGADVNSAKANGTTALMLAASSGSVEAVETLIKSGAKVDAKESVHGQTALMFAAALNRDAVVRSLLAHSADANVATSVHKLEHVRFDQDGNIVEDRAGGRGGAAKTPEAQDAETAAAVAKAANEVAKSDLDALSRGIGLKSAEYRLAKAKARAGDVAARAPRKVGADFQGGMTALMYAAREGHMDVAKALVEGKADLNQVSQGDKITPLVEAISNGHLSLAKYFLDHGADPARTRRRLATWS
jgi:ankyrin repeat protein